MFGKSMLLVICSLIGLCLVCAELTSNGDDIPAGTQDGRSANKSNNTGTKTLLESGAEHSRQKRSQNVFGIVNEMIKSCDVLTVTNGNNVERGAVDGHTVNITCDDAGMTATPATATCSNGRWSSTCVICYSDVCDPPPAANGDNVPAGTQNAHSCILLIGGLGESAIGEVGNRRPWPTDVDSVEYYHPRCGVDCNRQTTGNMSTARVRDDTRYTSGCYLPSTRQVVIRETAEISTARDPKPPMVYGLVDHSSAALPYPNPTKVYGSTAASVGSSKCISCGGQGSGSDGSFLNNCYQFHPTSDNNPQWTSIAPMPQSMEHAASVSLTQNDFFVTGGNDISGVLNKVYRYDVGSDNWTPKTPMKEKRHFHAAGALSTTEFIVCGGYNGREIVKSCEIYDTALNTWRDTGNMNVARGGHAMVRFEGCIYVLGGSWKVEAARVQGKVENTVEKYNKGSGTWEMVKAIKYPRFAFVGVAV